MYDVVIVGGGPAGLSAALLLGRSRRNVLLCDEGKPRNAVSPEMHGFLTRDGIAPMEFRRIAHEQLRLYPNVEFRPQAVVNIAKQAEQFTVTLADQTEVTTRKLLLTTGIREDMPAIPDVQAFYGKSVVSCPYCHGWEVRDQPFALYDTGKHAVFMAIQLLTWSLDIVICSNGPSGLDAQDRAVLAHLKIAICETPIARLEGNDGYLERIVLTDGETLPRRVLFYTPQLHPAPLAMQIGFVPGDPKQAVQPVFPGIYMAGDVYYTRWASGAAAAGTEIAVAIHTALLEEDFAKKGIGLKIQAHA